MSKPPYVLSMYIISAKTSGMGSAIKKLFTEIKINAINPTMIITAKPILKPAIEGSVSNTFGDLYCIV
jgi:hypothetical protein